MTKYLPRLKRRVYRSPNLPPRIYRSQRIPHKIGRQRFPEGTNANDLEISPKLDDSKEHSLRYFTQKFGQKSPGDYCVGGSSAYPWDTLQRVVPNKLRRLLLEETNANDRRTSLKLDESKEHPLRYFLRKVWLATTGWILRRWEFRMSMSYVPASCTEWTAFAIT